MLQVLIIGGGAAGFFTAINCAELARTRGQALKVSLLEATRRPLTKVRISGGGRCNVTHSCFDPAELVKNYPRGAKELRGPFSRFQPSDTVAWFERRGVKLKAESDGRMFPVTDDSDTIASCLLQAADQAGVDLKLGAIVRQIAIKGEGAGRRFVVSLRGGETLEADKLMIATGSMPLGYELARGLGHELTSLVPSLFTFKVNDLRLNELAGLSFPQAALELRIDGYKERLKQRGPLLITHWGLSGPAVLKLSAFAAIPLYANEYRAELTVNLLPHSNAEEVRAALLGSKKASPKRGLRTQPPNLAVPKRYWQRLVDLCGAHEDCVWADLSKKHLQFFVDELLNARFTVTGKGEFKEEFVTAGGIRRADVDFRTMESRIQAGLYFAGEVLDVDGITGGFNFQNAWTTAFVAAQSMIELGT